MTLHEQQIARQVSQCVFLPGSREKRFARDMGYYARHDPEYTLTTQQCRYLGHLAWRYRVQMVAHGGPVQGRVPTLERQGRRLKITAIAKTREQCYGLSGQQVFEIEPVEYYFCQAAKVPEVTIAALSQQTECPQQECQLLLAAG